MNIAEERFGASTFLSGITELSPGAGIPQHFHNCEESVTVLVGCPSAEVDRSVIELQPFDTTLIPAGIPHRFFNGGQDLAIILWTYGSVRATRTVVMTGVETPIAEQDQSSDPQSTRSAGSW